MHVPQAVSIGIPRTGFRVHAHALHARRLRLAEQAGFFRRQAMRVSAFAEHITVNIALLRNRHPDRPAARLRTGCKTKDKESYTLFCSWPGLAHNEGIDVALL